MEAPSLEVGAPQHTGAPSSVRAAGRCSVGQWQATHGTWCMCLVRVRVCVCTACSRLYFCMRYGERAKEEKKKEELRSPLCACMQVITNTYLHPVYTCTPACFASQGKNMLGQLLTHLRDSELQLECQREAAATAALVSARASARSSSASLANAPAPHTAAAAGGGAQLSLQNPFSAQLFNAVADPTCAPAFYQALKKSPGAGGAATELPFEHATVGTTNHVWSSFFNGFSSMFQGTKNGWS